MEIKNYDIFQHSNSHGKYMGYVHLFVNKEKFLENFSKIITQLCDSGLGGYEFGLFRPHEYQCGIYHNIGGTEQKVPAPQDCFFSPHNKPEILEICTGWYLFGGKETEEEVRNILDRIVNVVSSFFG